MSALQKAQKRAIRIEKIPDGRIRYYAKEILSKTKGKTRGASRVTEYNPTTGKVRTWHEC
jgi:filamentous hemagglutinin